LIGASARAPERPFLLAEEAPHTFADVDRTSDSLARTLQRMGVVRGDRVALMIENSAELVVGLFGILKAGGVFVVLNPTTKAAKLSLLLNDCGVRALIAQPRIGRSILPALRESPTVTSTIWTGPVPALASGGISWADAVSPAEGTGPADPHLIDADLAAIIYTSGSTGHPKGVMLTHRNMTHSAWSISRYLGNVPEDVVAMLLPMSFGYGLFQVIVGASVGCTVLIEKSFAYPYEVMQRIARHRVTGIPGVPTIFATILHMAPFDGLDLSSVRYLTNAAAALPPAHVLRLRDLFPRARMFAMYGQTECTRISYLDPDRILDKSDSVGKAIPNTEAFVVDERGRRAPPGVVGELVVRGASIMRGYWGKPEETAERLREGEIPGEMVLYTGDQFRMDEEGDLYFVGRTDDIFKCKGEKISPREIENVLYEMEDVAEAAVIGVPDEMDGTAIKAVVAPRTGRTLTEQQVRVHCRERLESYTVPKFVEIRGELPKTESGKIKKSMLV
jgi:long-chain acyl-CoA synthetase